MLLKRICEPSECSTDESRAAIPTDIEPPTAEKREKTVFLFHDESIFHSNRDTKERGLEGDLKRNFYEIFA